MLSILIPVYQYDCSRLVGQLIEQADAIALRYELILGDDASDNRYASIYDRLAEQYQFVKVYRQEKNIGAGRMRNALAREAQYSWLLILDSDVLLGNGCFLTTYLSARQENTVVVGGFVYDTNDLRPDNSLRYIYGTRVEQTSANERAKYPYNKFIAMAMLIPREIMLTINFPEDMGMGYEDAAFGHRLATHHIPIVHIECPVIHRLKETNKEFLDTTRRYVYNLHLHRRAMHTERIKLLRAYERICRYGLRCPVALSWHILQKKIEHQLCSKHPSLKLFGLYKLGYLCSLG